MSQLVWLEGKHTAQRAHCALWFRRRKAFWNISERKTSSRYGRSLGDMQREVSVQGGQLLHARSPNGEYLRKILESTDHTLVPMHYKQLAGQVWHSPNFKRKKCWEQTCKERNNEHEHTSTKYIFFIDWGKKDHFLHLWKRVWNRMQAQHFFYANEAEDTCLELKLTKLKAPWDFSSETQLIQRKELHIAKGITSPGVGCFN